MKLSDLLAEYLQTHETVQVKWRDLMLSLSAQLISYPIFSMFQMSENIKILGNKQNLIN